MQVHLVKDIGLPLLFKHPLVLTTLKVSEIAAQKRRKPEIFATNPQEGCGQRRFTT
jgi:hypothetical protein